MNSWFTRSILPAGGVALSPEIAANFAGGSNGALLDRRILGRNDLLASGGGGGHEPRASGFVERRCWGIGNVSISLCERRCLSRAPIRDFAPIVQVVRSSPVLLVNPSLGVRTLPELIAIDKKKPGQLNFGSNGSAGSLHVLGEMLRLVTGIDFVHIPYKGTAPMLNAILANEAQIAFDFAMTSISHIKAGTLVPLLVTGPKRISVLPSTPTAAEAGFVRLEATTSGGYLAPAATDASIIARLNRELTSIIRSEETSRWLVSVGIEPIGGTPEAYKSTIAEELTRWRRMIRLTGVKADE